MTILDALEATDAGELDAKLAALRVPVNVLAWIRDDGRHRYRCRALPPRLRVATERRHGLALVERDRGPVPLAPPLARLARSLDRHAPPALGPPREVVTV